jgi:predicted NAD/FAD-binding protein
MLTTQLGKWWYKPQDRFLPAPATGGLADSNTAEKDFRSRDLLGDQAAIPKLFSSSSLPPSLASGRFATAFLPRARADRTGPLSLQRQSLGAASHADGLLPWLKGKGHPRSPSQGPQHRVAIVGAGIAGLSAAWALSDRAEVTVFEANDYAGGHTHTVDVTLEGQRHGVDTGFLVFNERTYPLLIQLFAQLGVQTAASDMSFSVQVPGLDLEWSGSSLDTVFAQRRNLLRPAFWGMLRDLLRFNRLCTGLALRGDEAALSQPIGEFLREQGFGAAFRDWYLLPMVACIWSCPTAQMLQFPIRTLIRFCHNHGLLQVSGRPRWFTVRGGARHYVEAMRPALHDLRLNSPVRAVQRDAGTVRVLSERGWESFDAIVLAGHSDQSLALLADASPDERRVLGAIAYQPNRAVLHTDARLLPQRRKAWAAWNYEREAGADADPSRERVCLHYLLNQLQPLPWQQPVIVSLNPVREPAPETVIGAYDYAHPVFDEAAVRAQARLPALQGQGGVWFAGAWTRYGFHEDGLLSGLGVARQIEQRWYA